jgi:alginate O-acetyltransferase complex protein AlgI
MSTTGSKFLFALTAFAWIFFRAENLPHAIDYISGIFSPSILEMPAPETAAPLLLILGFVSAEWLQRRRTHPLQIDRLPWLLRKLIYLALAIAVITCFGEERDFIYFQF